MFTIKCWACGGKRSVDSIACPHCGDPGSEMRRRQAAQAEAELRSRFNSEEEYQAFLKEQSEKESLLWLRIIMLVFIGILYYGGSYNVLPNWVILQYPWGFFCSILALAAMFCPRSILEEFCKNANEREKN